MNEERTDLRRICYGIGERRVASLILIASEERAPFAPSAAATNGALHFRDEIGPIVNQCRIDAEDMRDRSLHLRLAVESATQLTRRDCNQIPDRLDVPTFGQP